MTFSQKQVRLLWIAFALLTTVILAQNLLIFLSLPGDVPQGGATMGNVSLCLNTPPYWLNPIECDVAATGTPYGCDLSALDADDGFSNYSAVMLSGNANGSDIITNVSVDGSLNFTAEYTQTGNYTIRVTATDDARCPLSATQEANISIVDGNSPPILIQPVPDSTWEEGRILVPYNLNTYFIDPDGGPLAFRATGNTQIAVTINSAGEVTLNPAAGYCGTEIISYIATDITNLTATSNDVTLTVECAEDEDDGDQQSGGGGGGGGGGFSSATSCQSIYHCYEWSDCQYTEAVTPTGDATKLNITGVLGSRVYLVEDMPEDTDIFYSGFQWRECIDTNKCETRSTYYTRTCSYEPSCSDHIQNQNEEKVDCGGVCAPCGTCEDGIQNGLEEGIDCGGECSAVCHSCTDGIINGLELAVDCGGPDCEPCQSCFDGVQNRGETGVDCGGPCEPCAEEQTPGALNDSDRVTMALLILILIAALLVGLLVLFKNVIKHYVAVWALRHKKRNRVILLDHDSGARLLNELSALEARMPQEPALKRQAELGTIVRKYFRAMLGIPVEFSTEQLQKALAKNNIHPQLQEILLRLFTRSSSVEFLDDRIPLVILSAVIKELRWLIQETAVRTPAELRALHEERRNVPHIPDDVLPEELAYSLLGVFYEQLALGQFLLAEKHYRELGDLYGQQGSLREFLYPDLDRAYLELHFAITRSQTLLSRLLTN